MSRTVAVEFYTFDELEDSAKERARDWFREGIESDELTDHDDWQAIAEILGVEFKTRAVHLYGGGTRQEPCIWWSGFSSQGDGASFEGWYRYAAKARQRIRAHAPQDKELHRIADELAKVQHPFFYRLQATITHRGHYYHSGTMQVDVSDRENTYRDIGDAEEIVTQCMRDFADWIYSQLEAQWTYLHSEECVDETILANEYEFHADGSRA